MVAFSPASSRSKHAEALVADLFEANGWNIEKPPEYGGQHADLLVRRGKQCLAIEVKALREGRADRVIPLLSQAILQAQTYSLSAKNVQPVAVISVENASESLSKQVASFVEHYAPNVAVGLVSETGFRYFKGAGLEELSAEGHAPGAYGNLLKNQPANLFSDLNQWLLKVMLAPEISNELLQAPRQKYRSGAELANAAMVSAMSASRFLQQLRNEGYLEESSRYLGLVRREELFRRWRSAVMRSSPELPMRFLLRGIVQKQIQSLLARHQGESCLALFSAADALGLGHVSGVPPSVYVPKLPRLESKNWKMLTATSAPEIPDIIVRQALSPESVFRGAVNKDGLIIADVIQVWLDVANHPSRGEEQANLIYQKILRPILGS